MDWVQIYFLIMTVCMKGFMLNRAKTSADFIGLFLATLIEVPIYGRIFGWW